MQMAETKENCQHKEAASLLQMGSVNYKSIIMPCAACKFLRRRCTKECIFLPHFPPTEPQKFAAAHRIFGASNISKLLQEIPVNNREDAVISMVYEASARLRDPVYGCVGMVAALQKQVAGLQCELNEALSEAGALRKQLSEALPMLAHPQDYKLTSDIDHKNTDNFHFPQLMSPFSNEYDKDVDGMLQSLQVLDSCQCRASGNLTNHFCGYES